jgi:nicotinamide-nucleotide amidase
MTDDAVTALIAELTRRHLTVGVAESLTGGLLVAELIRPAGASAVVLGGIVAYSTELKHSLLGVDAEHLAARGPVDPEVAVQMAVGVRDALKVDGTPANIGVSTTGVAGPGPQDGHPAGTVFIGLAYGSARRSFALQFSGTRNEIRQSVVSAAVTILADAISE